MKLIKSNFIVSVLLLLSFHSILFAQNYVSNEDSTAIVSQLSSYYGVKYELWDIVNVDTLANRFGMNREGQINNPYGTLDNCIVFTANREFEGYSYSDKQFNSIVGVYKNGTIIWKSDFITPLRLYGGRIMAIADLTNDGKADIVTVCTNTMTAQYTLTDLWVYSWDGSSGVAVVDTMGETGEEGESVVTSYSRDGGFNFIDYEGDGVWEIVGYSEDAEPENYYSWNGNKYIISKTIAAYTPEKFYPRNNFTPIIGSKVLKLSENNFEYKYSIKNSQSSRQAINEFDVYGKSYPIKNISVPNGWYGDDRGTGITWWDKTSIGGTFSMKYNIKPGKSLSNFSYETNGLPIIADAYLRGFNYDLYFGTNDYTQADDYLHNSVIVKTIAAKLPPSPFVPLEFIDTLITYTDSSYSLGWIQNEQTRDKYDNYFNNAKNYLTQNNNNAAKSELQKVLTDCNADSSTVLTSEAYALLYFNTEYLLTKIEDGGSTPIENSLSGSVKITVAKTDSINTFSYTVANNDTSSQAIKNIYVEQNTGSAQSVNLPDGWTNITGADKFNLIGFKSQSNGILSGTSQSGYAVATTGLPTIGNVYLQSGRSRVDSADIFGNSYVVETIVPTSKPAVFNPNQFVDTLIYYNNESLSNNWLTAEWVKNVLASSLNNAKLFINQKLYQSTVPVMQQLITILDSYKANGFVKEEAYYLLKNNSEYLLKELNILIITPPAEAVAQLDTIFAANELNKTNSWYSAAWVYNVLTSILNNARITLNQNNLAGTKLVIQQFVITLDSYKTSGFITEEGLNNIKPKCLTLIDMLK